MQIGEDRIQLPQAPKMRHKAKCIAFARPDELRIHAQPQDNAIQATFLREVWIAGKVVAELHDRQGNLIEIAFTSDEAKTAPIPSKSNGLVKCNRFAFI